MASYGLRDRDAIVSREGIIFRVYGYWHPPRGYVCDVEYAPSTIYRSKDPRAIRVKESNTYFKFYEHDGLAFIENRFPQYRVYYEPIQEWLVGVGDDDIASVSYPDVKLRCLLSKEPEDELIRTLEEILNMITSRSSLRTRNFGVFGSLLHGFYHPKYSDIDLTIIGRKELHELLEVLEAIHHEEDGILVNEFEDPSRWSKRSWKFTKLTLDEYGWFQKRKLIYNIYTGKASPRPIKIEFEPIKERGEIVNEYDSRMRIHRLGMVEAYGTVLDDSDGPYMPAVYGVELDTILGLRVEDVRRIVSYVEEFRMQVREGERIHVVGNLERVSTPEESFHQIVLTYCPQYYNQVLKLVKREK